MPAASSKTTSQETEFEGRRIIFRGGRGAGYSLEWETRGGSVRVSSRKKKHIFQVFRGIAKISSSVSGSSGN